MLERDLRETFFTELSKYISKKNITNGEFVRIFYLSKYFIQLQEKKGIEKKTPWPKTEIHLRSCHSIFSLLERKNQLL